MRGPAKFNFDTKRKTMTISELFEQIAAGACKGFSWCYDIRRMQNVTADNMTFPVVWMEEYYSDRNVLTAYSLMRELTVEIHFQDLVPMQGVAIDRERVRERLRVTGVEPFMAHLNLYALRRGMPQVEEWQCDPEPPMFDANATGVLLRFTFRYPSCMVL